MLEGMCCSITGSSIPAMEVTTCQSCLVNGSCSARPDTWDLGTGDRDILSLGEVPL